MNTRFYLVVIILLISSFAFGQGTWWQVSSGNIPTTNNLNSVYFVNANTGIAVGEGGVIIKTTDGGYNWSSITSGTTADLMSIMFVSSITGWISGDEGIVLKTTDGGNTWVQQLNDGSTLLYDIFFLNANLGWTAGYPQTAYKTTNGGVNWDSIAAPGYRNLFIFFQNENTGWSGGRNGHIKKTADGGDSWIDFMKTGTSNNFHHDIMFVDSANCYLATRVGEAWHINVIDSTYEDISPSGTNWHNSIHFFDTSNGWLIGDGGRIVYTENGGTNWTDVNVVSNDLNGLYFHSDTLGWIVGDGGTVLKYTTSGNVTVTVPDTVIASGTSNIKVPVCLNGVVSSYDIYSFQFQAGFDNSKLTFIGIDTVGTLSGGYTINYNNPIDSINLWAAGTKEIEDNGILLYLDFDVEAGFSVGDTVEITFSSFMFNEGSPDNILNNGSIILVGSLELYGDVNLDDQITQTDAEILMTYGIGDTTLNDTSKTAAEVTDNGSITAYDASYILQKVLNPSLVFPAGNTFVPKVSSTNTNWAYVRIPDTLFSYGTTSVEMPVTMSNYYSYLYSYQVKIGYDNSKLTFTGIDTVGTYSGGSILKYKNVPSDTILLWCAKGIAWIPYSCDRIINLKFDIDYSFPSSDSAEINFSYFIFNEGDPYVITHNGSIKIAPQEFYYGDVSLDETISSYDASVLLSYGIGDTTLNDTSKTAAEVSGNGTITAYDASLILRYVVGYISSFPAGSTFTMKYDLSNTTALYSLNETAGKYIDYIISINNAADVYSSNIDLEYSGVELVSYNTTDITSGYLTADRRTDTGVRIALAGSEEMSTNGEILRLRFRRISEDYSINLRKFVANEVEIEILDLTPEVPSIFTLSQNYPNPFNPETNIKYQIPENSHVVLKIYNILGQEVRTLVYEEQPAGFYNIKWNGANNNGIKVSSGVYVYRIKAGKYRKTMKMVYLR